MVTSKNTDINAEKTGLHPRNPHRIRYDFLKLVASCPELSPYVNLNKFNDESIDFANPDAVKALNKAILIHFYKIKHWDIPANYLCPPIPGRADYLHYLADLLASSNGGVIPQGKSIKGLDIGLGSNCVYPIIGNKEYGWSFIGSDIDVLALKSAKNIVAANPSLKGKVDCRQQTSSKHLFQGILTPKEYIDFTICNPPFHASAEEASAGSVRKLNNLNGQSVKNVVLNFGGQANELWCEGGEARFIRLMILESAQVAMNCFWFTSLVSKKENLAGIYKVLAQVKALEIKTVEMKQGQKTSRFVAWTFLNPEQQHEWRTQRWM